MAICEYDGDKSSCVKVYKNKNVLNKETLSH